MEINANISTDINIQLEVADPRAAAAIYEAAFGLGDRLGFRAAQGPSTGFRGFLLSLVVSQPSTVDSLVGTAVEAGFTVLKPAKKSLWGYSAVVQGPEGTIWKIATSKKKDVGPFTRAVDDVVLLMGVADVKASKQFYADRGLTVSKSFGGKYAEFENAGSSVTLALYPRKAAAKEAGVALEGSGSHRIVMDSGIGSFTDADGFVWETAA
ncbi:glyoxalase [Nocardia huaxiensis]|uniref:Glyoxalase n=1 Tax=Nocardia huaxiensis TaxID=2755382 RepID=A0A7D6VBQ0_9NOCA|nr:glyoxalase [Nocardia huaxiensis]QLY31694.1 glyoxalase [Nocardia huaxiensis]UFS95250.1 glyoxalase [Nocardia huaxiensis]